MTKLKTYGTYFVNDEKTPLRYGEIHLINPKRKRRRGESPKSGIEALPVFCGFCGTDFELMKMGRAGRLCAKFPNGQSRLVNGHEGVVWVPEEKRFAIVLIRGGDSFDPTRFTDHESYFEYGCDGADGIFCDRGYFHPDMLLRLPKKYEDLDKLPLSLAKKLVFCDPYACAIFQHERMTDIGEAQNFRVVMAQQNCKEQTARKIAGDLTFARTVIFGLGTTGLFIGDQIRRNHKNAKILFIARSDESSKKVRFVKENLNCDYLSTMGLSDTVVAEKIIDRLEGKASVFVGASAADLESRLAFDYGVLGCNGIYNSFSLGPKVSFDSMPFGFKNQVILSSINFTQKHMEKAIEILCNSNFDELVALIDKDEFISGPIQAYENKIFCKGAPLKTAVIWNEIYLDMEN